MVYTLRINKAVERVAGRFLAESLMKDFNKNFDTIVIPSQVKFINDTFTEGLFAMVWRKTKNIDTIKNIEVKSNLFVKDIIEESRTKMLINLRGR